MKCLFKGKKDPFCKKCQDTNNTNIVMWFIKDLILFNYKGDFIFSRLRCLSGSIISSNICFLKKLRAEKVIWLVFLWFSFIALFSSSNSHLLTEVKHYYGFFLWIEISNDWFTWTPLRCNSQHPLMVVVESLWCIDGN
jgi:hypothetical protein